MVATSPVLLSQNKPCGKKPYHIDKSKLCFHLQLETLLNDLLRFEL